MPFDYEEYQKKTNEMSTEQLHKEWENYTRQLAGGATSTATSVLFSPFTAGISLMGLGLSAPRVHNARKKREIIEAGLKARGATHNTRKRDVIAPMAVAGTLGGLTLGLAGPGADMIAGAAVGHGMEYAAAHVALDSTGAVLEHKHDEHSKKKAQEKVQQQYENFQKQYAQEQSNTQFSTLDEKPQAEHSQPGLPMYSPEKPPGMEPSYTEEHKYEEVPIPAAHTSATSYAPASHQQQYAPPAANASVRAPLPYTLQQPEKYLVTIPSPVQIGPLDPEKSAAYTAALISQPSSSSSPTQYNSSAAETPATDLGSDPPPAAPTMEEEILFLRMRLLQLELEKRQAAGPAPLAPPVQPWEALGDAPQTLQILVRAEPTFLEHIKSPQLHIETAASQPNLPLADQQPYLPPPSPSLPPRPVTPVSAPAATTPAQIFTAPPLPQVPYESQQQTFPPPPPSPNAYLPQTQQQYFPPPPPSPQPQIQQYQPQNYRPHAQFSAISNGIPAARPQSMYSLAPTFPLPQYQPHAQQYQPQLQHYQPQPQPQPAAPFQRQDSGYYSGLSTPATTGTPSLCPPSSQAPYNTQHNPQYSTPNYQPQYGPAPSQQQYKPQQAPPSPSPSTNSSIAPPPPYFPPPPTTTSAGDGKGRDYFTQSGQVPGQAPNRQSWYGTASGTQGWQWGTGR